MNGTNFGYEDLINWSAATKNYLTYATTNVYMSVLGFYDHILHLEAWKNLAEMTKKSIYPSIVSMLDYISLHLTWTWRNLTEGNYLQILETQWMIPLGANAILMWLVYYCMVVRKSRKRNRIQKKTTPGKTLTLMDLFDLAKTAYEPGHREALIQFLQTSRFDINFQLPSTGLNLFLSSCLSGDYQLVNYLLCSGGDVRKSTSQGDSALYLATYGVLNSSDPCIQLLQLLITHGCDINCQNMAGYTPLHRAASKGNVKVVKFLLSKGADPTIANSHGIFPMDSATNAGHQALGEMLAVDLDFLEKEDYVWDVVEPHTPKQVRLGLQSPGKTHLLESSVKVRSLKDGIKQQPTEP